MQRIAVWNVTPAGPKKLTSSNINLEKELEEWIEKDPALLEQGLVILARQLNLEGGRLDLLALDLQANFVVIEIKKGIVSRDTITQAIDYSASIDSMPIDELSRRADEYLARKGNTTLNALLDERGIGPAELEEPRRVRLFVVGTGKQPGLERIVDFLSSFQMAIAVVSYEVFQFGDGEQVLIRELTEKELAPPQPVRPRLDIDALCAAAEQNGIGRSFRALLAAAQKHGLYPRLYPTSVMYAPPANHSRMLFTIWAKPKRKGILKAYIGPEVFAEFYPVAEGLAKKCLGPAGWREMTGEDVSSFIEGLDTLFASIANAG